VKTGGFAVWACRVGSLKDINTIGDGVFLKREFNTERRLALMGVTCYVMYRVSHETWQLLNNFVCLHPYIILDIKDFLHVISLKASFSQIILIWNQFFNNKIGIRYFSSFSLISNNLTNYGRGHFKPFSNCHVSWDTL